MPVGMLADAGYEGATKMSIIPDNLGEKDCYLRLYSSPRTKT